MPSSHPYISGPGNIAKIINQLRKSFPAILTSETVKKLGLAPNNESYVINALQFVGLIGEDGAKTSEASRVFSNNQNEKFSVAFSELIKKAYSALFDLHGEEAWSLDNDSLITFFRQNDNTGDSIGKRQAATFKMFAGLSGHGEPPTINSGEKAKKAGRKSSNKKANVTKANVTKANNGSIMTGNNIGLTVRVEITLPTDGTKETYDAIFKSLKENLIDG